MISNTVEQIYRNAIRLLEDAELLYRNGRYESAVALAVLSLEESGKACLVIWKEEGLLKGDLAPHIRYAHFHKQRIFYCYRYAKETIEALEELYSDPARAPKLDDPASFNSEDERVNHVVMSIRKSIRALADDDDVIATMSKRVFGKTRQLAAQAEFGILDQIKHFGFYKDVDENLEVSPPPGIPYKACADEVIEIARAACDMPKALRPLHAMMAAIYAIGPMMGTPKDFAQGKGAGIKALITWTEEQAEPTN
jgi:hypothetical protein